MSRPTTTAERLVSRMAYNRETFKDKVEEKVGGALLEWYKAALARSVEPTHWVEHWENEANRLLDSELVVVLLHSIKGFKDRPKAAAEVLRHLRAIDSQYRRAAEHTIRRDYRLKKLTAKIPDDATEAFFQKVKAILETHS